MLVVYHYSGFKLGRDDVAKLMATRGILLSHQTVHNWVQVLGLELGIKLRQARRGTAGNKWHMDATYIKVEGHWCYLCQAIDKQGNLVDVYLSDVRELMWQFFRVENKTRGECRWETHVKIQQYCKIWRFLYNARGNKRRLHGN